MKDEQAEQIIHEEKVSAPQMAVMESTASITLDLAGQGSGKSRNIGYETGMMIQQFPKAKGFIGANTEDQLSQSTLTSVFSTWAELYGITRYDKFANPSGVFVIDRQPPAHFPIFYRYKRYNGVISFWNGCSILVGSLQNYLSHEGKEFAYAHLDETKDTKKEAITTVILGRLRQYGLWYDENGLLYWDDDKGNRDANLAKGWSAFNPLKIHSSPAVGTAPWLNDMFQLEKFRKEIKAKCEAREKDFFLKDFDGKRVVIYSAYHNECNLPPGHLQQKEKNLNNDELSLQLIDGYPFKKTGGECYPKFNREKHVKPTPYIKGKPVFMSWDFNGLPHMTAVCCQIDHITRFVNEAGTKYEAPGVGMMPLEVMLFRFYREYCPKPPFNTIEEIGIQFSAEHDPDYTELTYYGDSQGLNKIEGLGTTCRFTYVEQALYMYMHSQSKQVKNPNVGVFSRIKLLNDILSGLYPDIEIQFDPSMTDTIEDFENVKKGVDGKVKTRKKDTDTGGSYEPHGHETDAVEYLISEVLKQLIKK